MDGCLIAANVSPLYFLPIPQKKSDNLEQGNLTSKTDAFISFLILTLWKEIFIFSETVKPFLSWATEVFAWNSFPHPKELGFGNNYVQNLYVLANNIENSKLKINNK